MMSNLDYITQTPRSPGESSQTYTIEVIISSDEKKDEVIMAVENQDKKSLNKYKLKNVLY